MSMPKGSQGLVSFIQYKTRAKIVACIYMEENKKYIKQSSLELRKRNKLVTFAYL